MQSILSSIRTVLSFPIISEIIIIGIILSFINNKTLYTKSAKVVLYILFSSFLIIQLSALLILLGTTIYLKSGH